MCIIDEPSLALDSISRPPGHHAAQCVNMLREGCVKPCRGRASRIDQVREGRARSTARKLVDRHLTRAFHGVVPQLGVLCSDQRQLVTDGGHRDWSPRGIHLGSASIRGYLGGYWKVFAQTRNSKYTSMLWRPHQILLLFSSVQRLAGDQSRPCTHG